MDTGGDGLSRNLNMAREGYTELDPEKSKMAHLGKREWQKKKKKKRANTSPPFIAKLHAKKEGEHKKAGGAMISSIVFGGLGEANEM
jgi:hypothetical protein